MESAEDRFSELRGSRVIVRVSAGDPVTGRIQGTFDIFPTGVSTRGLPEAPGNYRLFAAEFDASSPLPTPVGTTPQGPRLRVDVVGSGTMTFLGPFAGVQHHFFLASNPSVFTEGYYEWTGLNGSIFGRYAGRSSPTANPNVITFIGGFSILGGTGRFAGALGGGSATGTQNLATGQAHLEGLGVIAFPGS